MASNSPVDFPRLAVQLLPPLLRRPRLVAWLQVLLAPLRQLYTGFLLFAARVRQELTYNSQTLVFEAALNDQFDPDGRRIRILNSDTELEPFYVSYQDEQQPPQWLTYAIDAPPWKYLNYQLEFDTQIDFTVRVPALLKPLPPQLDELTPQLHTRIRHFKLATRRYSLKFV